MKNLRLIISFILVLIYTQCAKQSTPQGGPRDMDPPKLLEANPNSGELNVKPEEVILLFNEYIKLDNPNKNILITPRLDKDEIITTALKDRVVIELNQELEDSTTYVFNFQNSIQDLSEGNPAENLKVVFSTGPFIDSLTFSGNVNHYWPNRQFDFAEVIIGLYPENDTTELFTAPPYYLTRADSIGNFRIENIRSNRYRAYAFHDANNSNKAESKSEAYDFLQDTLTINQNIAGIQFNLSQADLSEFKLSRSSYTNGSYEIILNKAPVEEQIEIDGLGESIFFHKNGSSLKLFAKTEVADSLETKLLLIDSVGNKIDTTIWSKFPKNERRPDDLSIIANSGSNFTDTLRAILQFNKPIVEINTDSLFIPVDTSTQIQIKRNMFFFTDSTKRTELAIDIPIGDSLPIQIFTLTALDSTFLDITGEYNKEPITLNYRQIKKETLADVLSGRIEGSEGPFIFQLLDGKGEKFKEIIIKEGSDFVLQNLEPGNYQIRIIEDRNENGRWDPGNFYENRLAERVFYFLDQEGKRGEIILKSGWTNEGIIINATKATGTKIQ